MSESIVRNIAVKCSIEHAFRVFTERIDMWWPPGHRFLKQNPSEIIIEARTGGRFYEKDDNGNERDFGHVLVWEPPNQLSYAWYLGASAQLPTEVVVRFQSSGEHTHVEVVHRASALPLEAWSKKIDLYRRSWNSTLEAYEAALNA